MNDYSEHYLTGDCDCSICGESIYLDDLEALDFHAENSGVQPSDPNGPTVYWAEGTIACPSCGARLWVQVAS